ncbi:MAG: hypothetical protein IPG39_06140 [Bacteroidetes bacterium]|nr:hypothetical protein [Bacteroidota bacterium]
MRSLNLTTFIALTLLLVAPLFSATCFAQKLDSYTTNAGWEIKPGDTLSLGVGSLPDGRYDFIYSGLAVTIFETLAAEQGFDPALQPGSEGALVVVSKIRKKGDQVMAYFIIDEMGGYLIEIENAIQSCELAFCRPDGYLTQQEFEKLILINDAVTEGRISPEKRIELRNELLGR